MPADPTTSVKKTKPEDWLSTEEDQIGHVAPSFEKEHVVFNTLVVRPVYRISLRLGDIEKLFLYKPDSEKGRMERMQVAGLFYFPLNHEKAGKNDPAGDAYTEGWKYLCDNIAKKKTEADADKWLADRIKNWVVDGGALPPPAEEGKKPTKDNFKKIRFPGGYTYIDNAPFCPNNDAHYQIPFGSELAKAEEFVKKDNPMLGAIPLVATVEKRDWETNTWKPEKDVSVYFQLVKPYDLPAFDEKIFPMEQLNCPPLRSTNMQVSPSPNNVGPAKHVKEALAKNPNADPDDPQVDNCHKDFSGKRGLSVDGNIFETSARKGFTEAHTGDRAPVPGAKEKYFAVPTVAPAAHKFAVCTATNEDGEAGVIFMPSTMGGDRYRIRAYVGPKTIEDNGTGWSRVSAETGTLVVWRNLRISKCLYMPCDDMAKVIESQLKEHWEGILSSLWHSILGDTKDYYRCFLGVAKKDKTLVRYSTIDLTPKGDPSCVYEGFIMQLARAFCEVDLDSGADKAEEITDDAWRAALKAVCDHVKADPAKNNNVNVNIDKLIFQDKTKVTVKNSFALIPLLTPKEYNKIEATKQIGLDPNGQLTNANFSDWFDNHIVNPFIHCLVNKGCLPGISIVQTPTVSTWQALNILNDYSIGLGFRTCIVRNGKDIYPYTDRQTPGKTLTRDGMKPAHPGNATYGTNDWNDNARCKQYGYSTLLAHEWGHCLFCMHAPPKPVPNVPGSHDNPNDGYCLMTYLPCEGHFCGKCVLGLRGWKNLAGLP